MNQFRKVSRSKIGFKLFKVVIFFFSLFNIMKYYIKKLNKQANSLIILH